jgi:hypothetical protein
MADIHLLSLPRELRDLVYSYILSDRIQLVQAACDRSLAFYDTNGMFLANHQLRNEALDTFYRLLPEMTVVAPGDAQAPFLSSPRQARLRETTQNLVIQTTYRKRNLNYFALSPMCNQKTNLYISHILQSMPALRKVTCEVAWEPREPPAVLLPRIREQVLTVLRWMTLGDEMPVGWHVECQIRDATRWKNEWSGVVILRKM